MSMLVSFVLYPVMGMRAYINPISRIVGNSVLFPLIARLTCTDLIYVRTKSVSPRACWSSVLAVAVSTSSGCGFDSDLHESSVSYISWAFFLFTSFSIGS